MSRRFNLKSILGEVPDDEFEDIESITEPVPTEAIMGILTKQTEITRVKTLVAPSPEQLDIKVNKYLEEIETKTEIKLENIHYAANDQGYSVMLVCKRTS